MCSFNVSGVDAVLPIYGAASYSVLSIKDLLNTPDPYIQLALKVVGEFESTDVCRGTE